MLRVARHRLHKGLTGAVASLAVLIALVPVAPAGAISPDVVISEVYGGGGNTGVPLQNDFVELFNRSAAPVAIGDWSVQYASATGTGTFASNGAVDIPVFSLQPGQRFLIKLAGGANGVALPAADATGTINMSGTNGKVVLVRSPAGLACNGGSAPCDSNQLALIADLIGYGNANFFEGTAAPVLSNTTSASRNATGNDTDNNAADFTTGTPTPENSSSAPPPPPPPPPASGCDVPATQQIAQVQGSGDSTPLVNQNVRVEGIVTGDFQDAGQLGGFFIQDDTPDADSLTSDGIFVFSTTTAVKPGDRVLVNGKTIEFNGLTELSPATAVDVCGTGNVGPAAYDLPRPAGATFEPVEGVLLTFPEALTATEHFQLGRFGEVAVSANGRLYQPTDQVAPGAPAQALAAENALRRLLLDDGSTTQNPPTVPYLTPEAVRIGDTASGVTGVLSFGFGQYRLQPTAPISFARTNPRPTAPEPVGGDVQVASFNTLNCFTTLGSQNPNAQGADTAEEFQRQQAKEVAAIKGLDADVLGLMEVENNGSIAIGSLVEALNSATAPGTYALAKAGAGRLSRPIRMARTRQAADFPRTAPPPKRGMLGS